MFWQCRLPVMSFATGVLVYILGGHICVVCFQLGPEHAVTFCRGAVRVCIWHPFFGQLGFDVIMLMNRLDGNVGLYRFLFHAVVLRWAWICHAAGVRIAWLAGRRRKHICICLCFGGVSRDEIRFLIFQQF